MTNKAGLLDLLPSTQDFHREVSHGLSQEPKTLPAKLLYDQRGSELFEEICQLESYYPARCELEILWDHAEEICADIGAGAMVIEPGAGNAAKVRHLLACLERPVVYVPIEIAKPTLLAAAEKLRGDFPDLTVLPVCADYTEGLALPPLDVPDVQKRVGFFPGSTIGNFDPGDAESFLRKLGGLLGESGQALIGVDLKKDPDVFQRAYDDPEGITAEFNLNILRRLNREFRASFNLDHFRHQALYNETLGRVEMHLVSLVPQIVAVGDARISFREGESIHTENSYKYSVDEFRALAESAGYELYRLWQDGRGYFGMFHFVYRG
jgi:dimethylhistidine N-methyltransferase